MLETLSIENIALIDSCVIEFGRGLNILSGETGAGKSIILDALGFVLGARADRSLIRHGESSATVKGMFDISASVKTKAVLEEYGIECDGELLIVREMNSDNKNTVRVNGEKITLSMLKNITDGLVDIYGQHDNNRLLSENNHLPILDGYIGKAIETPLHELKERYSELSSIRADIKRIGDNSDIYKRLDILEYQIKEIENADLKEGEEEELIKLNDKYSNVETILGSLNNVYSIFAGEYNDTNVADAIGKALSELGKISEYDADIESIESRVSEIKDEIRDITRELSVLVENVEYDPVDARRVEDRLDVIRLLKRKYGSSVKDVLKCLDDMKREYDEYSNAEERLDELKKKYLLIANKLLQAADKVSAIRKEYAVKFEKAIIKELEALGMKGSVFKVDLKGEADIDSIEKISPVGYDNAVFLISANVGQDARSLSKIISGGELSRFMLAIKNIAAKSDNIDTMVFDEIDTGISGRIAEVVAEKLYSISKDRQVLAVTHLPQLGAMADCHFGISKSVVGNKTVTNVRLLDSNERTVELARLIGGSEGSKFAALHAEEMLEKADIFKKNAI
ncbi:MAG: DNA repair protein RecN [Clostridia bacterium]|jgi:DNA repair protein RecN (Recombination protein N)|nr:DNA repair protein RecN [Clostridia bacterium]